jgi:FKBP-type peptidyl-prolyl cis-trans isomerase
MKFCNCFSFFVVALLSFVTVTLAKDMSKYLQRTGKKYLDEKAKEPGVIKLKSGMLVEILKSGEDPAAKSPKEGDSCEVTYSGKIPVVRLCIIQTIIILSLSPFC